jgi:hypothetical protein
LNTDFMRSNDSSIRCIIKSERSNDAVILSQICFMFLSRFSMYCIKSWFKLLTNLYLSTILSMLF